MSAPSTAILSGSTHVKVNESDIITSGGNTSQTNTTHNVQTSYNIVFFDVISFIQHFVAWFRSRGHDPVEISDIVPLQIPSLPVSSVADRYTRCMLECLLGYPLYSPKPFSESKEYLRNGVKIGDVGFVRLINPPNLPDYFSLKTPEDSATRDLDSLPRNTRLFPQTVIKTESDEYTCKGSEGATLVLPEGALSAEAIYMGRLEDLAKRHGVEWYEYTKARGRSISNGSLYLVTSFTKCTQWGIALFDRPCSPGQALTFSTLGWEGSGALFTKVADTKQGDTPNQCVFLRGYKIMIRQDIFDKLPTRQLASRIRGGGEPGGTGLTSRIKKLLTGESPLTRTAKATTSTVTKSDEVTLHANFNTFPVHPSDLLNTELLSQNPDAKVALTHDDVWCDILRGNFPKLNYETLMNIARLYTSAIDKYGCVSFQKNSDSRNILDERSRPVRKIDFRVDIDLTGQIECTTEIISSGGSSCVYKGRWVYEAKGGFVRPHIVVKVINLSPLKDKRDKNRHVKQIKRELALWSKISHKNILPLLGIAQIGNTDTDFPAFVSVWMKNGNAKQFRLRNPSFSPLCMLYDIIQGLHYLHTFEPEIVHGDIKAANVLINDRYEACLCDFGLSRFLVDSALWISKATQAGGSLRWMSPELITGEQSTPTKESDIYAYAMTCYEIITCDIPFKSVRNGATLIYSVTVEKQRPQLVEARGLDDMWDIITKCWAEEPEDRPHTTEVLELVKQKVPPYPFSIGRTHPPSERLESGPELATEEQDMKTGQVTSKGTGGTEELGTETSAMIQPSDTLDLTGQIECTTELIERRKFWCVYKGRWIEKAVNAVQPPIVVKTMNLLPPINERFKKRQLQSKQIERELEVWSKFNHKNILPLLGIAYINNGTNIPAFISPWMENGNAKQFRLRHPDFPTCLILYDIIQGLHYLHTFEPEIIHGDIKAINVLINDRYEARLCDFGLSRSLTDSTLWKTTVTQAGATLLARWMSPELITGEQSTPTRASDIYSYAMTCYEIITCDVPFKSVTHDAKLIYIIVVEKQRPEYVDSCGLDDMWDIITRCWAEEPEDRPHTAEVLELVRTRTLPIAQTTMETTLDKGNLTGQIELTTEFIGQGGFGRVYKGRWVEGAVTHNAERPQIVVKVINLSPPTDENQKIRQSKQIKRELELWSKISHKNILPLLGIAQFGHPDANFPAFISAWMKNGNAMQFRSHYPKFPPLCILYDIIQGLHYLHSGICLSPLLAVSLNYTVAFEPEIIHSDIKADNVLINERHEACLCDFGLSRFLVDTTLWRTTAAQAGASQRWMSPELITGKQCTPTKESDIYSYAMTCYEIITRDVPFKSVHNDANLIYNVTVEKQRPKHVELRDLDGMWDIITKCWAEEPKDRPHTAEVLELVRARTPPHPSLFPIGQSHLSAPTIIRKSDH